MEQKTTPDSSVFIGLSPDPFEMAVAVVEGMYDHFNSHLPTCLGAAQMTTVVGLLRDAWDSVLLEGNEDDARARIIARLYSLIIEERRNAREETAAKAPPVAEG